MKKELLNILSRQEGYISGERLSRELGVTRTAVWKQVRSLREQGYDIDAMPRLGYRLMLRPDRLLPQEIARGLTTEWLGREVVYLEETDSTNEVAKRLARDGAKEGVLVVAERQTQGKGRLGRHWVSPKNAGIYFTIILRPPLSPQHAPRATLMAAVAVARALIKVTGLPVKIKWPNDLLINGRKAVGILTELSADMDRIHYLVIGIGINVNLPLEEIPPRTNYPITSLQNEIKQPVSRREILQACLQELENTYQNWLKAGFPPILKQWKELSHTLGQQVTINLDQEIIEGLAEDLDEDGSLLVRQSDGEIYRVIAGEVLFPNSHK